MDSNNNRNNNISSSSSSSSSINKGRSKVRKDREETL
jgi:hypothetical protein